MFPLSWPVDFEIPKEVSFSNVHLDFIDRVGTSGLIARLVEPGLLRYGAAVATLAGTRTFLYPGNAEPSFNFACVLTPFSVENFGVAGSSLELEWINGNIAVRRVKCVDIPLAGSDDASFERLQDLPFVELQAAPGAIPPPPACWPEKLWPKSWGDPVEVVGIGATEMTFEWFREWKHCYERPGRNTPGTFATLFEVVFKRPWATTKMGKLLRSRRDGESSDEDT
jgi:hypothetical protein